MRSQVHNLCIVVSCILFMIGVGNSLTGGEINSVAANIVDGAVNDSIKQDNAFEKVERRSFQSTQPTTRMSDSFANEIYILERKLALAAGKLTFASLKSESFFNGSRNSRPYDPERTAIFYVNAPNQWDVINTMISSSFTGVGFYPMAGKDVYAFHVDSIDRESYLYWVKFQGELYFTNSVSAFADACYSPSIVTDHYSFRKP